MRSVSFVAVALACGLVVSCGKNEPTAPAKTAAATTTRAPQKNPAASGDFQGSADPSASTSAKVMTTLVKNLSQQDGAFKDQMWNEYGINAVTACFQLVERLGKRYVQISNRPYDNSWRPGEYDCKPQLVAQNLVIAEFGVKAFGNGGIHRLVTSFGDEVGSYIERLADNEHKDSIVRLCSRTNHYNHVCRIQNDGHGHIKAFVAGKTWKRAAAPKACPKCR